MSNFFNSLLGINIPLWILIASPAVLILFALFLLWFVHTRIFKFRLRRIVRTQGTPQSEEAVSIFVKHYPPEKLVRYSRRMERYSRHMGTQIIMETSLTGKWIQKVTNSTLPTAVDLRRVLLYCPSSSVFKAYLAAEQHPRLRRVFTDWMKNDGEEKVIRLLSETCRGEEFEPDFGKSFLENNGALLRELTGEPEWYARYFAYKILIHDKEE
ncbi:MAG: hypothetical protein LBC76_00475, partial [Treponema sp.]|nr:hypothetical protein [Treponema sp.]